MPCSKQRINWETTPELSLKAINSNYQKYYYDLNAVWSILADSLPEKVLTKEDYLKRRGEQCQTLTGLKLDAFTQDLKRELTLSNDFLRRTGEDDDSYKLRLKKFLHCNWYKILSLTDIHRKKAYYALNQLDKAKYVFYKTGQDLDLVGDVLSVPRLTQETDDNYRKRLWGRLQNKISGTSVSGLRKYLKSSFGLDFGFNNPYETAYACVYDPIQDFCPDYTLEWTSPSERYVQRYFYFHYDLDKNFEDLCQALKLSTKSYIFPIIKFYDDEASLRLFFSTYTTDTVIFEYQTIAGFEFITNNSFPFSWTYQTKDLTASVLIFFNKNFDVKYYFIEEMEAKLNQNLAKRPKYQLYFLHLDDLLSHYFSSTVSITGLDGNGKQIIHCPNGLCRIKNYHFLERLKNQGFGTNYVIHDKLYYAVKNNSSSLDPVLDHGRNLNFEFLYNNSFPLSFYDKSDEIIVVRVNQNSLTITESALTLILEEINPEVTYAFEYL